MFVETNALSAGVNAASVPKKNTRSSSVRISLAEQVCFVLNAVISKHGQLVVNVNKRGKSFMTPQRLPTSTPFTAKTAFESDTGMWVFDVGGTFYYPQDTSKFQAWVEEGFALLERNSAESLTQPPMNFTRIS